LYSALVFKRRKREKHFPIKVIKNQVDGFLICKEKRQKLAA
jgi:hypothetical protein